MNSSGLSIVKKLLQANILLSVLSFATAIILARAFDPSNRGQLAILTLLPNIVSHIALMGIHLYLARNTANNKSLAANNYRLGYQSAILLASFFTFIFLLLSWLVTSFNFTSIKYELLFLSALAIPASMLCAFQMQMELGRQNTTIFNLIRFTFAIPYTVLILLLYVIENYSLTLYLTSFVTSAIIALILSEQAIKKTLTKEKEIIFKKTSYKKFFELIKLSKNFNANIIINTMSTNIDKLLIAFFFDTKIMGLYVIALTTTQLQNIVGESISQAFFSKISAKKNLLEFDKNWLTSRLRQSVLIYFSISFIILIFGEIMITSIFGIKYKESISIFYMLVPSIMLTSAKRPFEEILKAGGIPLKQAKNAIVTTLSFAILGSIAALIGSIHLVLLALFISSLLGFILIVKTAAMEINEKTSTLIVFKPSDIKQLISQAWHTVQRN